MKEGDLVYINFDKKAKGDDIEEIGDIYQNMTGVVISVNFATCTIELSLKDKEKVKTYNRRTKQRWVVTPKIPHKFLFLKKSLLKNE
jgi:predicted RNA-binding protein with RPS1 domain